MNLANITEESDRAGLQEIKTLLTDLNIKHVVFVDDAFDEAASGDAIDRLIGSFELLKMGLQDFALANPTLADFLDVLDDGELKEDAVIQAELRDRGSELPDEFRAQLLAILVSKDKEASETAEDDARPVVDLEPMLQGVAKYHPVKASEWNARKGELLAPGHETTLIFFDRNLGDHGGAKGGEILLASMSSSATENVYFGLFTHDAQDTPQEIEIAEPLISSTDEAVSVMGKYRLSSAPLFAEGLRVFLYSRELHEVRRHTAKALSEASEHAQAFLAQMGLYSLMASSTAAYREGLFEPEGPLRMVNGELRRALDIGMRANPPLDAVNRIRKAAKKKLNTGLAPNALTAELVWNERFDSSGHLSGCHLPLEAGDIFQITFQDGEEKYYILLAQACDLIVRIDGKRTNAPPSFSLAQVRAAPKPLSDLGNKYFPIGRFNIDEAAEEWVVELTQKMLIAPEVLDACVLSSNGNSELGPNTKVIPGLTHGWQMRSKKLEKWRAEKVSEATALSSLLPPEMDEEHRKSLSRTLHTSVFGPGFEGGGISSEIDPDSGVVSAKISRVAHLVEGHSRALLILASQHQARPDQDGPLFHDPTLQT